MTKYVTWSPHESVRETRRFIHRCVQCWKDGTAYPWIIELKTDNELIGMVELRINGHLADMGYVIAREYWGNSYATEAVKAIVDWSLTQPGLNRVWAVCDVENTASARVLEKAGLQREGTLRSFIVHPNLSEKPRDVFCYSAVK